MAEEGPTREWVTFDDPKDDRRTWQIDVTFLLVLAGPASSGAGARACSPSPAPELVQGCCSYGAHFSDRKDRDHVVQRRAASSATTSGSSRTSGRKKGIYAKAGKDDDGKHEWRTRLVDDACIFLNRPGFAERSGVRAAHPRGMQPGTAPQRREARGLLAAAASPCRRGAGRRQRHLDAHASSAVTAGAKAARSSAGGAPRSRRRSSAASPCTASSRPSCARCSARSSTGRSSTYLDAARAGPSRRRCATPPSGRSSSVDPEAAHAADPELGERVRPVTSRRRSRVVAPVIHDGRVGREEQRGPAMSSGTPMRPQRVARRRSRPRRVPRAHGRSAVFTSPGADRVDAHRRRELERELPRHVQQRGLRRVVHADERRRPDAAERGDVHDGAAVLVTSTPRQASCARSRAPLRRSPRAPCAPRRARSRSSARTSGSWPRCSRRCRGPPRSSVQRATAASSDRRDRLPSPATVDHGHAERADGRVASPSSSSGLRREHADRRAGDRRTPRRSPVRCRGCRR